MTKSTLVGENFLSGKNKYFHMTTPNSLNESEAIVLPDPLTLLQGFVNFLLFPLFALSAMTRGQMQLPPPQQQLSPPVTNTAPVMQTNEEKWEWIDYKGRDRQITVYRKVKVE